MKKIFSALLLIVMLFGISVQAETAITVNSEALITDTAPTVENGQFMIPMRAVFEKLGFTISWDGETSTAFAFHEEKIIMVQIANDTAFINGESVALDIPAKIVNSRTLIPASFIESTLGVKIMHHSSADVIEITSAQ